MTAAWVRLMAEAEAAKASEPKTLPENMRLWEFTAPSRAPGNLSWPRPLPAASASWEPRLLLGPPGTPTSLRAGVLSRRPGGSCGLLLPSPLTGPFWGLLCP